MSNENIDYGNLMHDAMRGLIRKVLSQVQEDGLPGEHHFFISFSSQHPGVRLADWLVERFPDTMTIVMQHWFDDLEVGEEGFGVTLNFNDQPENMFIPYDAIRTFVDPSVEFGLKFESQEGPEAPPPEPKDKTRADDSAAQSDKAEGEAEVVSLDAFRR